MEVQQLGAARGEGVAHGRNVGRIGETEQASAATSPADLRPRGARVGRRGNHAVDVWRRHPGGQALAVVPFEAQLPPDLVQLNKRLVHRQMEMMGMRTALRVGTELCALGTHQQSMHEFMKRVREGGLTAALQQRDEPFGDYRTER